jgi:hypothetical protein
VSIDQILDAAFIVAALYGTVRAVRGVESRRVMHATAILWVGLHGFGSLAETRPDPIE